MNVSEAVERSAEERAADLERMRLLAGLSPGAFSRFVESHSTDPLRVGLRTLLAERDRLREVLEKIVDPVSFMQKRADEKGSKLDGHIANALANDLGYLKALARQALSGGTDDNAG